MIQEAEAWVSEDRDSRLFLGDCLQIAPMLDAESVDCVWADPPYKLSNGGTTCFAGRRAKVDKGDWDRSVGVTADFQFNVAWLSACHRLLKPTGTIWVSGTLHNYCSVGLAMQHLGFKLLNDIIWEKPTPPPNLGCRTFTHSTEIILWAAKGKPYTFNYEAMKAENDGKQMKNVWKFPTPSKSEKRHGKHPTQKPIALIARCLRASSHPGDIVFDPFAGSATSGVAALALGRKFIGCEIDFQFVEMAVKRLQNGFSSL